MNRYLQSGRAKAVMEIRYLRCFLISETYWLLLFINYQFSTKLSIGLEQDSNLHFPFCERDNNSCEEASPLQFPGIHFGNASCTVRILEFFTKVTCFFIIQPNFTCIIEKKLRNKKSHTQVNSVQLFWLILFVCLTALLLR